VFTDGIKIFTKPYFGIKKIYYCGKEYKEIKENKEHPIYLIVIDSNSCAIGKTNYESISIIWTKRSHVMGKHTKGGWSQRRFERGREEQLKAWFRTVRDIIIDTWNDEQIIIGCNGLNKNKFINEIPKYLQEKIINIRSVGYTDENGLWELIKISRYQ